MAQKQRRPTDRTIEVDRIISVGQDRRSGEALVRLKDRDGRTLVLRIEPPQLRTLELGLRGLVEAREEE